MRTALIRECLLLTALIIWGARPILPLLLPSTLRTKMERQKTDKTQSAKDRLPQNPLSGLHHWLLSTEMTLKTLPIKDREDFLQHLEIMKGTFAKLIQRPLQKMDTQENRHSSDFLPGPELDLFYKNLEELFIEKVRLENNILHNLETYGLKV